MYTSSIHGIDFIDLKLLLQLKLIFIGVCVCRPEKGWSLRKHAGQLRSNVLVMKYSHLRIVLVMPKSKIQYFEQTKRSTFYPKAGFIH